MGEEGGSFLSALLLSDAVVDELERVMRWTVHRSSFSSGERSDERPLRKSRRRNSKASRRMLSLKMSIEADIVGVASPVVRAEYDMSIAVARLLGKDSRRLTPLRLRSINGRFKR